MEKQQLNAVKLIWKFNAEALDSNGNSLIDLGYDDERECAYGIEEMLEGFSNLDNLGLDVHVHTPKLVSREIVGIVSDGTSIPDVDRFDKHLDAIVFAFGSLAKLGLSPQQAIKVLGYVMEANLTKLSAGRDAEGKQRKPEGFVGPEAKLQRILDEREQ